MSPRRIARVELAAPNWHRRIGGAELSHFVKLHAFPFCVYRLKTVLPIEHRAWKKGAKYIDFNFDMHIMTESDSFFLLDLTVNF